MSWLRALHMGLLGFGLALFGEAIAGVAQVLPLGFEKNGALTWKALSWAGAAGILLGSIDALVQGMPKQPSHLIGSAATNDNKPLELPIRKQAA